MRAVYQGAVVTLAATCTSNTHEGILQERATIQQCPSASLTGELTMKLLLQRYSSALDPSYGTRIFIKAFRTPGARLCKKPLRRKPCGSVSNSLFFECAKGSISEAGRNIRIAEIYRSKEYIQKLREQPIPFWRRRFLTLLRSFKYTPCHTFPRACTVRCP
ncbi:hypothetical protein F5B22DRAFT_515778 [Xylaria bambusicola]|uniref:uncharacterized protein n=1 Tax=Xylaria bambusicola TaxID=326684 RepID=UPI0020080006|nr:uncharacterized protein F5B22DRAFT_515778 [Xylaria bambusicola]KAI0505619.1 hypothetical protein F5B22DRAFT_515778 [Xylaria bambusicola]